MDILTPRSKTGGPVDQERTPAKIDRSTARSQTVSSQSRIAKQPKKNDRAQSRVDAKADHQASSRGAESGKESLSVDMTESYSARMRRQEEGRRAESRKRQPHQAKPRAAEKPQPAVHFGRQIPTQVPNFGAMLLFKPRAFSLHSGSPLEPAQFAPRQASVQVHMAPQPSKSTSSQPTQLQAQIFKQQALQPSLPTSPKPHRQQPSHPTSPHQTQANARMPKQRERQASRQTSQHSTQVATRTPKQHGKQLPRPTSPHSTKSQARMPKQREQQPPRPTSPHSTQAPARMPNQRAPQSPKPISTHPTHAQAQITTQPAQLVPQPTSSHPTQEPARITTLPEQAPRTFLSAEHWPFPRNAFVTDRARQPPPSPQLRCSPRLLVPSRIFSPMLRPRSLLVHFPPLSQNRDVAHPSDTNQAPQGPSQAPEMQPNQAPQSRHPTENQSSRTHQDKTPATSPSAASPGSRTWSPVPIHLQLQLRKRRARSQSPERWSESPKSPNSPLRRQSPTSRKKIPSKASHLDSPSVRTRKALVRSASNDHPPKKRFSSPMQVPSRLQPSSNRVFQRLYNMGKKRDLSESALDRQNRISQSSRNLDDAKQAPYSARSSGMFPQGPGPVYQEEFSTADASVQTAVELATSGPKVANDHPVLSLQMLKNMTWPNGDPMSTGQGSGTDPFIFTPPTSPMMAGRNPLKLARDNSVTSITRKRYRLEWILLGEEHEVHPSVQ